MYMTFHQPIEAGRRLISPGLAQETGMAEYYDVSRDTRYIYLPEDSPILPEHKHLSIAGLATFSTIYAQDGSAELVVPSGSMSMHQALKSLSKDFMAYAEIFHQIGQIIRTAEDRGIGALGQTHLRSMLAGIAFSPNDDSEYGSGVRFVPPYVFDPALNLVDDLLIIRGEMLESGYFDNEDVVTDTLTEIALGFDQHEEIRDKL
jgi:hypothetical protein